MSTMLSNEGKMIQEWREEIAILKSLRDRQSTSDKVAEYNDAIDAIEGIINSIIAGAFAARKYREESNNE